MSPPACLKALPVLHLLALSVSCNDLDLFVTTGKLIKAQPFHLVTVSEI